MQERIFASDLMYLLPELSIVGSALLLSLIDLFLPSRRNKSIIGWLALLGIIVSIIFVIMQINPKETIEILNHSYRVDDFGNLIKLVLLVGTGLIILMSLSNLKDTESPHKGEYYYILLPAVLGGMVMASSGDLITLFVGLELLSISSYVLVAMQKKNSQSNESAFKYLVLGGISSALILYGMSFLYGISGSTNLGVIANELRTSFVNYESIIYLSLFLLIAGIGFKIAVAPFHAWAPDVYQGAFTPVAAFLAVVSKTAGFAILFRIMYNLYSLSTTEPLVSDIIFLLGLIAASAMIVGNIMALRQKNTKRLFAYSGIANSGYLLVPLSYLLPIVNSTKYTSSNFSEFIYYLIAYLFMNIGIFAAISLIEKSSGDQEVGGFSGLYYRAPYTAVAIIFIILSFAGLPISGGFIGKFFILLGVFQASYYWLGIIMILTTVISYYYYFGFIRQMFMRADFDNRTIHVNYLLGLIIWVCAITSFLMGVFPNVILTYIHNIFTLTGDLFIN